MEQRGSTLSCRVVKGVLLQFRDDCGVERLREVFAAAQPEHSLDVFLEQNEWIEAQEAHRVIAAFAKASGALDFCRNAGKRTMQPDALGAGYNALVVVREPGLCYRLIVHGSKSFNKAGKFSYEDLGKRRAEIKFQSYVDERNRNPCEMRIGQFQAVPGLWGGPNAQIEEVECQVAGAEACRYRIHWAEASFGSFLRVLAGAVTGALAAYLAVTFLAAPGTQSFAWVLAGAVAGFAAVLNWSNYAALRDRDRLLGAHSADRFESAEFLGEQLKKNEMLRHELQREKDSLEEKVKERAAELEKALQAKQTFIAKVTHELRTPLTLILSPLPDLLAKNSQEPLQSTLQMIGRSANDLSYYVDQLIDAAASATDSLRCVLEDADITHCVRAWADEMRPSLALKNQALTVADELTGLRMNIDVDKVRDIFIAIVGNASKFSAKGTSIELRLGATPSGGFIEVTDHGVGIDETLGDRIFDRFFQGSHETMGTGLGLHIARQFAELHRGQLTYRSQPGVGSTFRLELPLDPIALDASVAERRISPRGRRAADLRSQAPLVRSREMTIAQIRDARLAATFVGVGSDTGQQEAAAGADISGDGSESPNVLLVEAHADTRAHLAKALARKYAVEAVNDAPAAEASARKRPPDLIIANTYLPGVSGFELCERLANDSVLANVPKILLTARGGTTDELIRPDIGIVDCIQKPFPLRDLLNRVRVQLHIRKEQGALRERSTRLAAIGQYAVQISHDMRSPLTGVIGNADVAQRRIISILKKADLDAALSDVLSKLSEDVRLTNRSAENALELCNKIMVFLRSGTEVLDKKEASVSAMLEDLARSKTAELAALDINIKVELPVDDLLCLRIDAFQLQRAVSNLVNNSREAISTLERPAGSKSIWIRAQRESDRIIIRIADNGTGIPNVVREKLGRPFNTFGKRGGTGLGLALVWNVVLAHNGRIAVEADPPEGGAAFKIDLPLVADRAVEAPLPY